MKRKNWEDERLTRFGSRRRRDTELSREGAVLENVELRVELLFSYFFFYQTTQGIRVGPMFFEAISKVG